MELLLNGDCLEMLKDIPDDSIDSMITDPPAGISFMGNAWDEDKGGRKQWIAWMQSIMTECYRVLKPGAHGLVWAIPRTSHWTATALEDAGFEIRDVVTHIFGSGFPKSHNIEKAIGNKQFEGWGTALKPASEHWVLVRKPISEKTVAANTLKHGVGGINIDASRIGEIQAKGRFPANLVLSHNPDCVESCTPDCAVAALDQQSGHLHAPGTSGGGKTFGSKTDQTAVISRTQSFNDSGGASRFFYVAKASKKDKGSENTHPTVKSSALMTYLIKLITPPNGVVLDPFMGSGSTGIAAIREGFRFIGIEKEAEYYEIASKRIAREVA